MKRNLLFLPLLAVVLLCGSCVKEIEDTEYHGDLTITLSEPTVNWDQTVSVRASFGDYSGPEISRCGICYSTQPNPTVNNGTVLSATPNNGCYAISFSYPGGTQIYLRAFAENVNGITYSDHDFVVQPLKAYHQLVLSRFTPLSSANYETINHPDDASYHTAKHFAIKNIRSILVTSLATYNWANSPDGNIFISCANQDCQISSFAGSVIENNDYFDIWEPYSPYTNGWWDYSPGGPLFDNNTIGYTAHVYNSNYYSGRKVKSTRTNIGWLLEFNQPVCLTYTEWDTDVSKIYYSTNL